MNKYEITHKGQKHKVKGQTLIEAMNYWYIENGIDLNEIESCVLIPKKEPMKSNKYLDKILKDARKEYVPKDRHASDSQSITFIKLIGILDDVEKEIDECLEQLK